MKTIDKVWRQEVKKRGLDFFTQEVLGFKNVPYQTEWYNVLDNKKYLKILTVAPRNHIKSTAFTVNYPLYRIEEDHNIRILIVTNTATQGQAFLREITSRIERDQTYVDFAGQLKPAVPDRWTSTEIIIDRDRTDIKDPTISTVGVGGTILSKRADEIICDDILSPENTRTVEQRQKLKEWFYQVLLPVLRPGGRIIFVGTVWHPQDLIAELMKDGAWDYRKKFQAVISWPTHMELWDEWYAIRMRGEDFAGEAEKFFKDNYERMHEGVEMLWKERWPFVLMYEIYRSNRVSFEKSYQNNIISREDQKFKEEWMDRAKERGKNLRLYRGLEPDMLKEYKVRTGGIDSAAGEDEQDDDNAMITLGVRRLDDMVQLLGLERGKFSPKEWRSTITDVFGGFKHDRIVVESNGYQVALKRDLGDKNLPVVAFHTGGEKMDPFIGVESLAILFENDRIILPYDQTDPYTVQMVDQLVDELRQFPVGHTGDSAMALWFAYTALRDLMSKQTSGFFQMIKSDLEKAQAAQREGNGIAYWKKVTDQQRNT